MQKQALPLASRTALTLRKVFSLVELGQSEGAAEALAAAGLLTPEGLKQLQAERLSGREQAMLGSVSKLARLPKGDPRRSVAMGETEHLFGRHAAAIGILAAAAENPATAGEASALMGHCFTALGDRKRAIGSFERALKLMPRRGDLQTTLGALLMADGEASAGLLALAKATTMEGGGWQAYFELGNAHRAVGDQRAAIDAFTRAVRINPRHADSFNNRGAAQQSLNADRQAITDFDSAIAINRGHLFAWINKGVSLSKLGQYEDSVKCLEMALSINPAMGEIYHNLGLAQLKLERNADALKSVETALLVEPARTDWLLSKGNALNALYRYDDAVKAYRECVARNPSNTDARINMAGALQEMARHQEAIDIIDDALAVKPGYSEALWNKSNSMLAFGPSREAWETYEHRLHISIFETLKDYGLPLLGSDDIKGRKVLVQWEQRFGDVLQMLRYVPDVTAVCDAHWQVAPPLADIVKASFPGITLCGRDECPPGVEVRVPFTSLPLAMKTFSLKDIPAKVPYLRASDEGRRKWAGACEDGKLNVGIAWRGNSSPPGRTVPLAQFASLLDVQGVRFVPLQIDTTAEEQAILKRKGVAALGKEIKTFDDTAALIEQLDMVVTIDTAIAHLAGALKAKTLVLLKFGADWRWLIDRTDSPWYPGSTLFRQSVLNSWDEPLAAVRKVLEKEAGLSAG